MEKTIKMFIETENGKKLEQDVPQGLVDIYTEKGWKEVETKKVNSEKPAEKTYFTTKKSNRFKGN